MDKQKIVLISIIIISVFSFLYYIYSYKMLGRTLLQASKEFAQTMEEAENLSTIGKNKADSLNSEFYVRTIAIRSIVLPLYLLAGGKKKV